MSDAKVIQLPLNGHAPDNQAIAKYLRLVADQLDAEGALSVDHMIMLLEFDDGYLQRLSCGKPVDKARLVGLLQMGVMQEVLKP